MFSEALVSAYLVQLERALGDTASFRPIYDQMVADRAIRQEEAVEIASRFVAATAPSTSRARALERILKRHQSLASFKLKQRAMAGRSAA
jgi:hypothetical protein